MDIFLVSTICTCLSRKKKKIQYTYQKDVDVSSHLTFLVNITDLKFTFHNVWITIN